MDMDYRKQFDEVVEQLQSLSIDEIKKRLDATFIGLQIQTPILQAEDFVYRARRVDNRFNKSLGIRQADLAYPPRERARLGRVNRDGDPVFYCSFGKEPLVYELPGLTAGDEIIISIWQTATKGFINNVGYTSFVFEKLGAKRPCPAWTAGGPGQSATVELPSLPPEAIEAFKRVAKSHDINVALLQLISEQFACPVGDSEQYKYKLTAAIAELHLGSVNRGEQFAGLLYPSIKMYANGDNLALQPWYVDQHLNFRKAIHTRIKAQTATGFSVDYLDCARAFKDDGTLDWLGRPLNWTLQPGQGATLRLVAGADVDGDYYTASGGERAHWVATDVASGLVIEPR
jgi:hypothetical protein